jgi:hypothetical protein
MNNELTNKNHRDRALAKLRLELKKDTLQAESTAAQCGLWELLGLCYLLRVSRLHALNPRFQGKFSKAQILEFHLHDEAAKYAIGLVAKHGSWSAPCNIQDSFKKFDNSLIQELMRIARHINAKFETEKLLHVALVKVSGERDQDAIIDMTVENIEPRRMIYLDYGLRIENFTRLSKELFKTVPELVAQVKKDADGLENLFYGQFGLNVEQFCEGLLALKSIFENKFQATFSRLLKYLTWSAVE